MEVVKTYVSDGKQPQTAAEVRKTAGDLLDLKAKRRMKEKGCDYTEAFHQVYSESDKFTRQAYSGQVDVAPRPEEVSANAGEQVHALTKDYMEKHKVGYSQAMHAVLDADPALANRYLKGE